MQPTEGDVHVNRPLTNISIAFIQDAANFIAADIFPTIPVAKQSDAYWVYDSAYWTRDEMEVRAPATESTGSGYTVDASNTYYAKIWAHHKDIPDPVRANSDAPIDLDREATLFVTTKALIRRERLFSSSFFAGGVWTRDYDGVAAAPGVNEVLQWNDAASTPIEDVWDAKAELLERTGFEPNTLILGYQVYKTLVNHPDFIDRVKYGQTPGGVAMIDVSEMAQVFKIDKVLVLRSIYNTALEGHAKSMEFIGGKKALLVYVPPAPGLMTPSAGYIFAWTGYLGAGAAGNRIKRFRMEPIASDRVEIEMAMDMKKIAADLGAFWDTVVA